MSITSCNVLDYLVFGCNYSKHPYWNVHLSDMCNLTILSATITCGSKYFRCYQGDPFFLNLPTIALWSCITTRWWPATSTFVIHFIFAFYSYKLFVEPMFQCSLSIDYLVWWIVLGTMNWYGNIQSGLDAVVTRQVNQHAMFVGLDKEN